MKENEAENRRNGLFDKEKRTTIKLSQMLDGVLKSIDEDKNLDYFYHTVDPSEPADKEKCKWGSMSFNRLGYTWISGFFFTFKPLL